MKKYLDQIKLSHRAKQNMFAGTLSMLISGITFAYIFPMSLLNPIHVAWVRGPDLATLDFAQSIAAQNAFLSQKWNFPPGTLSTLAVQGHNSLLFSDALPWFSYVIKSINSLLPFHHSLLQFVGIEIFIAVFSLTLMTFMYIKWETSSNLLAFETAVFVLMLPEFLFHWYWPSLMYQSFIVAAIWLYRAGNKTSIKTQVILWGVLGFLSAMTHSYFVPMIFSIALVAFFNLIRRGRRHTFSILLGLVFSVSLGTFLAGGFNAGITGASTGTSSVGPYAADLLTFFDGDHLSRFVGDIPSVPSMEGFAYSGIAAWILVVLATSLIAKRRLLTSTLGRSKRNHVKIEKPVANQEKSSFVLLNILGIALFAVAVGPSLAIAGTNHWITHNRGVLFPFSIFRASGRFTWVLIFTALFSSIVTLHRATKKFYLVTLMALLLLLQNYEFSGFTTQQRDRIQFLTADPKPLPKQIFRQLKINFPLYFIPGFPPPDTTPWREYLIDFVANGGIVENFAYMNRYSVNILGGSNERILKTFETMAFPKTSYLVIRQDFLARMRGKYTIIYQKSDWSIIQQIG